MTTNSTISGGAVCAATSRTYGASGFDETANFQGGGIYMNYTQSVEAAELDALTEMWGGASRQDVTLAVDHPFLTGDHQLLASNGRRAEICYVMHRGDPAAGVLLHRKRFYPTEAYRLPTGGIQEGESVMETLAREIQEETGLVVGAGDDEVQVQRFLGLLVYAMPHRSAGRTFTFATYHFLVQMPADGVLAPQDPEEQIAGWTWRPAVELDATADILEYIGDAGPSWKRWADWGRFRALSHRFTARALLRKRTAIDSGLGG